jgi:hypothetical protein
MLTYRQLELAIARLLKKITGDFKNGESCISA